MSGAPSAAGGGGPPASSSGGSASAAASYTDRTMSMRHQQVQMWAAEHNMIDSGIQSSGNNSAAPSVMSGASSIHQALINQQQTPYAPPAMAPGGGAVPPPYAAVAQTAAGSQITINHLRNLIEFMSDPDPVVVENAANLVAEICRGGPHQLSMLCNHGELMRTLCGIAVRVSRGGTIKHIGAAYYFMSQQVDGLMALIQYAIPALVRLLSYGLGGDEEREECRTAETVRHYALSTVHNMLQHANRLPNATGAKEEMVRCDAHRVMLNMLTLDQQDKVLAVLVDCLHHFVTGSSDVKNAILNCGGTAALVQIMKEREYEKLLWITSRLLVRLSSHTDHKATIIRLGGVQALGRHLSHASQRLVHKCMQNLLNLSDEATQERNVDELLRHVVRLLGTTDRVLEAYCVGTLMNLTCNNQQNKRTIVEENGVTALVRTLQMHGHGDNVDIVESGLRALRHLVTRHELAAKAQADLRNAGGFQLLADLLESRQPVPIRWTLDLIANVAGSEEHVRALAEQPSTVAPNRLVLPICISALAQAFEHMQQFGERSSVGTTRTLNLAACAVFAVQRLARYPEARSYVLTQHPQVMQILVHMLTSETESLLRLVLGALVELLHDPQGLVALRQHQPLSLLNDLAHLSNVEIAKLSRQLVEQLSSAPGSAPSLPSSEQGGAVADWTPAGGLDMLHVGGDEHDADMQLSDVLTGVASSSLGASAQGDMKPILSPMEEALGATLDGGATPMGVLQSSAVAAAGGGVSSYAMSDWPPPTGAPQPSPATALEQSPFPHQPQWTDM